MRLASTFALGFLLACSVPSNSIPQGVSVSGAGVPEVPQTQSQITLSFAPVVKQAAPAVVNIYTKTVVERRRSPFADDPFFRDFFGSFFPELGGTRIE
ncbi:MAG: hypothetical protein AAF501_04595, partial [Pseudomonadota bacterium]